MEIDTYLIDGVSFDSFIIHNTILMGSNIRDKEKENNRTIREAIQEAPTLLQP